MTADGFMLDDRLSRSLTISLAAHCILMGVILFWAALFPHRLHTAASAYQVSIVDLKPHAKSGGGSTALPKATVEQALKAPPAPVAKPALPKAPDAKSLKDAIKAVERSVPSKTPAKPAAKDLSKEIERIKHDVGLKDAVSSVNQAENEPAAKAAAPASSVPGGPPGPAGAVSTGESTTGAASGLELTHYQAVIRQQVLAAWNLPPTAVQTLPKNTQAILVVYIGEDGTVLHFTFEQSSGIPFFDQSATRALRRASPLPAPPKDLSDEVKNKGVLMRFSPQRAGN